MKTEKIARWMAPLAIATLGALPTTPLLAGHVSCGDVITTDTTLDSDLFCTGDGIIIDGNGVTLDLGGYILQGDGDIQDAGVKNIGASMDNRIHNGIISGFGAGVVLHGELGLVENLVIVDAYGTGNTGVGSGGILVFGQRNTVQQNVISSVSNGIHVLEQFAEDNIIADNIIHQSCEIGISVSSSQGDQPSGTVISGNDISGCNQAGIALHPRGTAASDVRDNIVTDIAGAGISVGSNGNRVLDNTVSRAAVGIMVFGQDNNIRGNLSEENFNQGILLTEITNVATTVGNNTFVAGNTVINNTGNGIQVETNGNVLSNNDPSNNEQNGILVEMGANLPGNNSLRTNTTKDNDGHGVMIGEADDTTVTAGLSNKNGGSGVFVSDFATNTIIRRTTARLNDVSGLEIEGTATLSHNKAARNTHYGYDTQPGPGGINDLGGNRAQGNGTADCRAPLDFPNSPLAC